MFKQILLAICLLSTTAVFASDPSYADRDFEITFLERGKTMDAHYQAVLRSNPAWQNFISENGVWYVHFDESNQKPHRAFGQPIPTIGSTIEERALNFIQNHLELFDIPLEELVVTGTPVGKKYQYINFKQVHNGMEVFGSRFTLKLTASNEVIMFGADVYNDIEVDSNVMAPSAAAAFATSNVGFPITLVNIEEGMKILPIPDGHMNVYRPVYEVRVNGFTGDIPVRLYTLVDAVDGTIWYRTNEVLHEASCNHKHDPVDECNEESEKPAEDMVAISGLLRATVYPTNPYGETAILGLPFLNMTIGGQAVTTDIDGSFNSTVNGPANSSLPLAGDWSTVFTNNSTPSFNLNMADGFNNINYDGNANVKELSAFYHVGLIHEHMKAVLPSFNGMDFSLTTNVDVAGECNAFYDGASINFFDLGGGCNATSLISDVVYHEYGHGINNEFYQSQGASFNNGAMGEGYADFWGMSLLDSPLLGVGFYTTNEDPLRRYDIDPQIYPVNLTGEVHQDGEIICGAWWDTHVLMGEDWELTLDLFAEAYAGLQATAINGNEGQAFVDVLIDVLQADDDDGDISNGTPNGNAIIEGFDIHGITLLSNTILNHSDIQFHVEDEGITIQMALLFTFPFAQYLENAKLFYRINNEEVWTDENMPNIGGNSYEAHIPPQPAGTIVAYYLATEDINNAIANVDPIGANQPDPNLPYYILVGYELFGVEDSDLNSDFGTWETGVDGDIASTGQWEQDIPIGSFATNGSLVAPNFEHTGGADGELCFITGQSFAPDGGIGENDVDDGHTTLRTPAIDVSDYENPAFTYWRWYTNAPSGGANPGADWWQVQISNDGGDNWTYVENTKSSELAYRRNALRIADYVDLTDEVMLQFIASDSIRPGENLDGGSLIEAALDDFHLYDLGIPDNVIENDIRADFGLYPNPANDLVTIDLSLTNSSKVSTEIRNSLGQRVYFYEHGKLNSGQHLMEVDLSVFSEGMYILSIWVDEKELSKKLSVIK